MYITNDKCFIVIETKFLLHNFIISKKSYAYIQQLANKFISIINIKVISLYTDLLLLFSHTNKLLSTVDNYKILSEIMVNMKF